MEFIILSIILICVVIVYRYIQLLHARYAARIAELEAKLRISPSTQRYVIKGQLAEQLWPTKSDYLLSDMRFLGHPIDYIIFDGYTETKDNGADYIRDIIFAEIKTGSARLSPHQRAIRDAVMAGRIRWETINL